ncbi:MAG: type toxin-antitoxin system VapC family toxin [Chloroflexi bacterium]|nr:type toxin-antitoxin system VapC family toxin [Chloroflexota bacterium]
MTIVIDTSVLIDHLRGNELARVALRQAAEGGEHLVASVLTKVEVLAGMRLSEARRTRQLLDLLDWIEVDDGLAESAGRLANRYLRSHPGIDPVDYVIAATVERLGARLWTRNVKHFPMFTGLDAPY